MNLRPLPLLRLLGDAPQDLELEAQSANLLAYRCPSCMLSVGPVCFARRFSGIGTLLLSFQKGICGVAHARHPRPNPWRMYEGQTARTLVRFAGRFSEMAALRVARLYAWSSSSSYMTAITRSSMVQVFDYEGWRRRRETVET